MQRITNLKEAALLAAQVCGEWVRADDEKHRERLGRTELMTYAANSGNSANGKDFFYIISTEGAIGLAAGREYKTTWLFLPAEDFPFPAATLTAASPAASSMPPAPQASATSIPQQQQGARRSLITPSGGTPAAGTPQPEAKPQTKPASSGLRFCNSCGVALKPNARFCMECGKPV